MSNYDIALIGIVLIFISVMALVFDGLEEFTWQEIKELFKGKQSG